LQAQYPANQQRRDPIRAKTNGAFPAEGSFQQADTLEGGIKAINHGWHSIADNPEG